MSLFNSKQSIENLPNPIKAFIPMIWELRTHFILMTITSVICMACVDWGMVHGTPITILGVIPMLWYVIFLWSKIEKVFKELKKHNDQS